MQPRRGAFIFCGMTLDKANREYLSEPADIRIIFPMNKRLLSIDALRGVAALAVVFFHARAMSWIGIRALWNANKLAPNLNAYLGYLTFPVIFGWTAVPLFFVLSGYCIHRPHVAKLARDADYRIDLKTYFIRRLWRIYPVLLAAIVFTALLDAYTRHYFPLDVKLGDNSPGNFLANLLSLQGIAGTPYGTNVPLWTLSMEIHFYLVYPLLFTLTKRRGPRVTIMVVAAISLLSLAIIRVTHLNLVIFLPFWFTWTVGFLVAEREAGRFKINLRAWRIPIALALLIACALTLKNSLDLAEPLYAPAFGVLLAWSTTARGEAFWARRGQLLARVGIVSFSLYAFHYPFIIFLRSLWLNGQKSSSIAVPIAISRLCVGLGYLMFWLVERWSLKVPQRWSGREKASRVFGGERNPW